MNKALKTALLVALPTGTAIAAGYWGGRYLMVQGIIYRLQRRSDDTNSKVCVYSFAKELYKLSFSQLVLLLRYTLLFRSVPVGSNPSNEPRAKMYDQVQDSGLLDKLESIELKVLLNPLPMQPLAQ